MNLAHNDTTRMIENELNRDYEVNCNRCNKRLRVWHKCPYCQVIYFCDCYRGPLCDCITEVSDIRVIIDRMKQLSI